MHYTVIVLFAFVGVLTASKQSVGVEGRLTCNGKPYAGAKIKLYDHDTFTMDDKLGQVTTDNQGYFKVIGTGSEVSKLNAKFNVYHKCGQTIYNAQTIELSLLKKSRDCIN